MIFFSTHVISNCMMISVDCAFKHLRLKSCLQALQSRLSSHFVGSSREMADSSVVEGKEFQVSVPWGKIAGKEWGDPTGTPWLVLHGWLDNCGTFDTMAPIFPKGHRLLCFDLPGHGFSSHGPQGLPYHYLDGLQIIRRVARHFKLSKFSLMGHSMGGGISSIFSATHPDMVSQLVLLDIVKPIGRKPETVISRTRAAVDELFAFEDKMAKSSPPAYTYEEAKAKLMQASIMIHGEDTITEKSADILLKRGLVPNPKSDISEGEKSFIYSRDIRHRVSSLYGYSQDVLCQFAKEIKCPMLVIKATRGPYYESKERAEEVLEIYREHNHSFEYEEVEGSHHVHLNNPEAVIQVIEKFLEKYNVVSTANSKI